MLYGTVDYVLKDGAKKSVDWAARAHLVKNDEVVKMDFYQVYLVHFFPLSSSQSRPRCSQLTSELRILQHKRTLSKHELFYNSTPLSSFLFLRCIAPLRKPLLLPHSCLNRFPPLSYYNSHNRTFQLCHCIVNLQQITMIQHLLFIDARTLVPWWLIVIWLSMNAV